MSLTRQPGAPAASRSYQGLADLPSLLAFAGASTAGRSPLFSSWHPGDIVWELHATADQPHPARCWTGPDGVDLLAWPFGGGEVWLEALPSAESRVSEAVQWAENHWRDHRGDDRTTPLSIRAHERDITRIATLEALGYRKGDPDSVVFRMALDPPLPEVGPPPGFTTRDCVGVDPALRAQAHRDAWDHLDHMGIAGSSRFSTQDYLALASLPVYDPALDILAVAPDGAFAANCIAWADPVSGVGVFEPVGTVLPQRGRRLARTVITEALRRLEARGMREARVGTAHFNHSAVAAYLASGFSIVDRTHWWTKALA
jgi:hypothetical protein